MNYEFIYFSPIISFDYLENIYVLVHTYTVLTYFLKTVVGSLLKYLKSSSFKREERNWGKNPPLSQPVYKTFLFLHL